MIITNQDIQGDNYDFCIRIPGINPLISPILSVIPLQLFAYYVSKAKGLDVDKAKKFG